MHVDLLPRRAGTWRRPGAIGAQLCSIFIASSTRAVPLGHRVALRHEDSVTAPGSAARHSPAYATSLVGVVLGVLGGSLHLTLGTASTSSRVGGDPHQKATAENVRPVIQNDHPSLCLVPHPHLSARSPSTSSGDWPSAPASRTSNVPDGVRERYRRATPGSTSRHPAAGNRDQAPNAGAHGQALRPPLPRGGACTASGRDRVAQIGPAVQEAHVCFCPLGKTTSSSRSWASRRRSGRGPVKLEAPRRARDSRANGAGARSWAVGHEAFPTRELGGRARSTLPALDGADAGSQPRSSGASARTSPCLASGSVVLLRLLGAEADLDPVRRWLATPHPGAQAGAGCPAATAELQPDEIDPGHEPRPRCARPESRRPSSGSPRRRSSTRYSTVPASA